jgi:hypothetical protein
VEHREERIIVETDRHRITGFVSLPADGYRSRLTDYLNAAEREFLALTDVEVRSLNGNPRVEHREFIALSLRHVVLAMPAAEDASPRPQTPLQGQASRSAAPAPPQRP